jgi:hypothetical protein
MGQQIDAYARARHNAIRDDRRPVRWRLGADAYTALLACVGRNDAVLAISPDAHRVDVTLFGLPVAIDAIAGAELDVERGDKIVVDFAENAA